MEEGESPEEAAIRETAEEFGIVPKRMVFVASMPAAQRCLPSELFLCTEFAGEPRADGEEMRNAKWLSWTELNGVHLFPAFGLSLSILEKELLQDQKRNQEKAE